MKIKTILSISIAAALIPTVANAKYYVQPVVKQNLDVATILPSYTTTPIYEVESSLDLDLDVIKNGVTMTDIKVKIIDVLPNRSVRIEVSNNTMREFEDLNLEINHSGYTLDMPLESFTKKTILIENLISVKADSDIKFLDPYPIFNANSNEYRDPLTDLQIQAYYRLQTNLKTTYGRFHTYDRYMKFFVEHRNESLQDSWSKWFHNATYKTTKSYRVTFKHIGVSGGYWQALGPSYLNRTATVEDYLGGYGYFSHENSHSMGFKHGSGMAYGWDDFAGESVMYDLNDGLSSNLHQVPVTNDAFWSYDKDSGLKLYVKDGSDFKGFEWANFVYDSSSTKVGEQVTSIFGTNYPIVSIRDGSDILLQAKRPDSDQMVNYIIRTDDTGLGTKEQFDALYDPTPGDNTLEQIQRDQKRDELRREFPESEVWVESAENPLMVDYKGTEYPLCKFNNISHLMNKYTVFGHVEDGGCTIGEDNSLYRESGYTSDVYQVVDTDSDQIELGNLTSYIEQAKSYAPVCYMAHSDKRFSGFGYKLDDSPYCENKVHAYNGSGYGFSKGYRFIDVSEYFKPSDELLTRIEELKRFFPESDVWKSSAKNLIMANHQDTMYPVCKFNDVDYGLNIKTIFGYVMDGKCSIGDNNSLNGIQGFSTDVYQVADKDAGTGHLSSFVHQQDGVRDLCNVVKSDLRWHGVGYRPSGSGQCHANMLANNGNGFGFSSGHVYLSF